MRGSASTKDRVVSTRDDDMTLSDVKLAYGSGESDQLFNIETATLQGGAGGNVIDAHSFTLGSVILRGMGGIDKLIGGTRDDIIEPGAGDDVVDGGAGNDSVVANGGNDVVYGNKGDDDLAGGSGNDELYGGLGNDTLTGGDRKSTRLNSSHT